VVFALVNSAERVRWSLISCVAAMGWASLYCLREWQKGVAEYGIGYRPGYVTGDPNYFTASAILCLQAALFFIFHRRKKWELWFALAGLAVTIPAIIVTASRGGFIGLMAMAAFLVFRSRRPWRNGLVLAVPLAVALAILAAVPQSPVDRLLHPTASDATSANIRLQLWHAGLDMVHQHPVTGIGLGNFKPSVAKFLPPNADIENIAHNTYMENLAEMGVPGLLLFLAVFGAAFVSLERTRRRARRVQADFIAQTANSLQAGLFGFAFAIFFLSAEFLKLFWFCIFLGAALPQVLAASLEAGEVHSEPAEAAVPAMGNSAGARQDCVPRTQGPPARPPALPVAAEPGSAGRRSGEPNAPGKPSGAGEPHVSQAPTGTVPDDRLYDPANLTSPINAILTAPPRRER